MVLQTTPKNGLESYTVIGDDFQIAHKIYCPEQFERVSKKLEFDPTALEQVFAFLIYAGGSEIKPLYNSQHNAILSDRVLTFLDFKHEMVKYPMEKVS